MSEVSLLDPQECRANNRDATGRKWTIHQQRGRTLYFVRPDPDRTDAVIPVIMSGLFTNPRRAQAAIDRYLELHWEEAELKQKQSARKAAVKKEKDAGSTKSN